MPRKKKIELEQVFVKPVMAPPEYPDLVENAPLESPAELAPMKKGRGRPKGSKNKAVPAVENIIAEPVKAEPNTVLVASIAEDVMKKIIERREKTKEATLEAEKSLAEGKEVEENKKKEKAWQEIERKREESRKATQEAERLLREDREISRGKEMAQAKGPHFQKEKPPIPEELKEKREESLDVTRGVRESTEALVEEKARASEARELMQKKKMFEERERIARERRLAAVVEAEKAKESLVKPEAPVEKSEELARIRQKYAQLENQYSLGEKEKIIRASGQAVGMEEPESQKKSFWDKIKTGWDEFWTKGRK